MSALRTKAIVLRRTDYGEADRIIQFLTEDDGKVGAIAKAVRREKSKLAGGIELFAVSDIVLQRGKGDLAILSSARVDTYYHRIVQDYERLQAAYECLKIVSSTSETLDEPELYTLIVGVLGYLDTVEIPLGFVMAWFYLQLDALLGVGLNTETDADGNKLRADARYEFDYRESQFVLRENGRIGSDEIKIMRLLMTHNPGIGLALRNVSEESVTVVQAIASHRYK